MFRTKERKSPRCSSGMPWKDAGSAAALVESSRYCRTVSRTLALSKPAILGWVRICRPRTSKAPAPGAGPGPWPGSPSAGPGRRRACRPARPCWSRIYTSIVAIITRARVGGLDALELLEPWRRRPGRGSRRDFLVFGGLLTLGRCGNSQSEDEGQAEGGGQSPCAGTFHEAAPFREKQRRIMPPLLWDFSTSRPRIPAWRPAGVTANRRADFAGWDTRSHFLRSNRRGRFSRRGAGPGAPPGRYSVPADRRRR